MSAQPTPNPTGICNKCHGTGSYGEMGCFPCKATGLTDDGTSRGRGDVGVVYVVVDQPPNDRWRAKCARRAQLPLDVMGVAHLSCTAVGWGDTPAEALRALGQELRRRGMSGRLKRVTPPAGWAVLPAERPDQPAWPEWPTQKEATSTLQGQAAVEDSVTKAS